MKMQKIIQKKNHPSSHCIDLIYNSFCSISFQYFILWASIYTLNMYSVRIILHA